MLFLWRPMQTATRSCSSSNRVRNDPPPRPPGRRLAYPLRSRRAQQPYASAEPAHGLGRGRSAENGSVDRRPATLFEAGLGHLKGLHLTQRSRRANSLCCANRSGSGGRQGGGDGAPVAGRVYARPRTPRHATASCAAPPPLLYCAQWCGARMNERKLGI